MHYHFTHYFNEICSKMLFTCKRSHAFCKRSHASCKQSQASTKRSPPFFSPVFFFWNFSCFRNRSPALNNTKRLYNRTITVLISTRATQKRYLLVFGPRSGTGYSEKSLVLRILGFFLRTRTSSAIALKSDSWFLRIAASDFWMNFRFEEDQKWKKLRITFLKSVSCTKIIPQGGISCEVRKKTRNRFRLRGNPTHKDRPKRRGV